QHRNVRESRELAFPCHSLQSGTRESRHSLLSVRQPHSARIRGRILATAFQADRYRRDNFSLVDSPWVWQLALSTTPPSALRVAAAIRESDSFVLNADLNVRSSANMVGANYGHAKRQIGGRAVKCRFGFAERGQPR